MILADQQKPSLDELAHHGVRGMKWGIRKKGAGGVSRSRGAILDRNARNKHAVENMLSGKKYRVSAVMNKAVLLGDKRYRKYFNKRIAKMDAQDQRLMGNGKLTVRDKIDLTVGVSTLERHVSVRPSHA